MKGTCRLGMLICVKARLEVGSESLRLQCASCAPSLVRGGQLFPVRPARYNCWSDLKNYTQLFRQELYSVEQIYGNILRNRKISQAGALKWENIWHV